MHDSRVLDGGVEARHNSRLHTDTDSGGAAHRVGSWVARGAELGAVVDEREHVFMGVLRQEAALALTALEVGTAQVRIEGERARLFGNGRWA